MKNWLKEQFQSHYLISSFLILMGTFPILPNRVKGGPIIILLILAVVYYSKLKDRKFGLRLFIWNSIIYLLYILSLIFSSNVFSAIEKLETGLALIILPLSFGLIWKIRERINKELLFKRFVTVFFISVLFYTTVIYLFLIFKGVFANFKDPNFFRHFTEHIPVIGQHPIYASIFLTLGLLFSTYLILETKHTLLRFLILFGSLYIFILLISLASKGVILAFFVSTCVFIVMYVGNLKKSTFLIITIIGLILLGITYSPALSSRIDRLSSALTSSSTITAEGSSTEIRKAVYHCSFTVMENNWIFGTGVGDVNDSLMKCYVETSNILVKGGFNTHNQYLSILLSNGIVGLIGLFLFLFFNYYVAFKNRNHLSITILIFYSLVMLIENIFARQSGVILFSFLINFSTFLTYKNLTNQ